MERKMKRKFLRWCIRQLTKRKDLLFIEPEQWAEVEKQIREKDNKILNLENRINQTETDRTIEYLKGALK